MLQIAAADREHQRRAHRYLRAFILGIPLVYVVLLALDWNRVGSRDLDQFLVFHQLQYWNELLFGFAKQWTPVLCSGLSLAGEPQVPLLSLSMVLGYVFGPLRGIQLAALIYLAWGWCGAYLYAGLCTRERTQRLLAASLFIGNGFFVCRIGYGHVDFLPFLTLPSVLWLLHRLCERPAQARMRNSSVALAILALAAALSIVVDGSPVSITHLLVWIGCYALVLSVTVRCALPVLVVVLAGAVAALLDAGYLWPMVGAQIEFPRRMPDTFTNPLALPWFMLLPVRGKLILPATGNGHELSVFIGPVIALALWRYRRGLLSGLPASMRYPLVVVSIVGIWLGMGSLHAIHVPTLLSPFDWLRPLPGFRSLWVTGRYWCFLALPLSLLGAMALHRFALALPDGSSLRRWMLLALLFQFGFQIETLVSQAVPGRAYAAADAHSWSTQGGNDVRYVYCRGQLQGKLITPRQGVIDCYDNDDFARAEMHPTSDLVQAAQSRSTGVPRQVTAAFLSWNRIRLTAAAPSPAPAGSDARIDVVLNQAYHRLWRSESCDTAADRRGNMIVSCDRTELLRHPVDLEFSDPLSVGGARTSLAAWSMWVVAVLALSMRYSIRVGAASAGARPYSAYLRPPGTDQ